MIFKAEGRFKDDTAAARGGRRLHHSAVAEQIETAIEVIDLEGNSKTFSIKLKTVSVGAVGEGGGLQLRTNLHVLCIKGILWLRAAVGVCMTSSFSKEDSKNEPVLQRPFSLKLLGLLWQLHYIRLKNPPEGSEAAGSPPPLISRIHTSPAFSHCCHLADGTKTSGPVPAKTKPWGFLTDLPPEIL